MSAYYNEIDPFAAEWLRNLIQRGLIAPGDVDERSIADVQPDDLRGYRQVHFFAGIGGWSAALRLAGWPDDREVWTGSCPCQPFSAAGKRKGTADERHLWPEMRRLVEECGPATVFGEQVASADGRTWLAAVRADLEALGYAVGAADLCAASVGAPHIRQRLWWVADAECGAAERHGQPLGTAQGRDEDARGGRQRVRDDAGHGGIPDRLADRIGAGLEGRDARPLGHERPAAERGGAVGGVGNADCIGTRRDGGNGPRPQAQSDCQGALDGRVGHRADVAGATGFWSDLAWLPCRDGKARPTRPGLFPLAHGIPGRVGRLRAYGNAIVPQVAAQFIGAWTDTDTERFALSLM